MRTLCDTHDLLPSQRYRNAVGAVDPARPPPHQPPLVPFDDVAVHSGGLLWRPFARLSIRGSSPPNGLDLCNLIPVQPFGQ